MGYIQKSAIGDGKISILGLLRMNWYKGPPHKSVTPPLALIAGHDSIPSSGFETLEWYISLFI